MTHDQNKRRNPGRRVLINTGSMAGSSVWRIGISFVLQLAIARWIGLTALGEYTFALAILNVCQVLGELGLQTLLVRELAHQPSRRRGYFWVALVLQLGASLLIWVALFGLTRLLPIADELGMVLLLVGASLPFYAVTSAIQTIFQAGERMELMLGVEMFINTLIFVLSIGLLWLGYGVRELVGVMIITQAISAFTCWVLLRRSDLLASPQASVRNEWTALPKEAMQFYVLALADVLLHRIDILLLRMFAGEVVLGIYSVAYNIVRVLMKVIQSYWRALYPTFARLLSQNSQRYVQLCTLGQRYGCLALLFGALAAASIAEQLVGIFDENAADAAPVFRVLIWLAPVFLIESYAILILMVERRPLHSLWSTAAHLLTIAVLLPILVLQFGAIGAAWAALIAALAGTVVGLFLLGRFRLPIDGSQLLLLAGVTIVTALCALLITWMWPIFWLWRVLLIGLIFLAVSLVSAAISTKDLSTFRQAIVGNGSSTL